MPIHCWQGLAAWRFLSIPLQPPQNLTKLTLTRQKVKSGATQSLPADEGDAPSLPTEGAPLLPGAQRPQRRWARTPSTAPHCRALT